jgi:hypothetical protein
MHQKFRRDYLRRKETGRGIEHPDPSLLAHIGEMAEIPCNEVIDLMDRSERDVHRVRHELSVEDPAGDVPFSEYGRLVDELEIIKAV